MNLWHCTANGIFGQFGDYIHAKTKNDARMQFLLINNVWPNRITLKRRAAK